MVSAMKTLRITTCRELKSLVKRIGFIPLFENEIDGFSVMEITRGRYWWTGDKERDPWVWRMLLSEDPGIAYGKVFGGRAGFVSREWFPYFASCRRDGYDFDARYEDGKASHKCRKIMNLFDRQSQIPSYLIKAKAGFSKDGEKGFEGAITLLQMQTYITVRNFTRKQSKSGEYYGWHVAVYSTSEDKFGSDCMTAAYGLGAAASKEKLVRHLVRINPGLDRDTAEAFLR
jgi:hypothetical protein